MISKQEKMQSADAETISQFDSRMATPCNYYALGLLNSSDEAPCVVTGLITAEQSSEDI